MQLLFFRITSCVGNYVDVMYFSLGKDAKIFMNPNVNDRELFLAFNIDTHPASLLRYKDELWRKAVAVATALSSPLSLRVREAVAYWDRDDENLNHLLLQQCFLGR